MIVTLEKEKLVIEKEKLVTMYKTMHLIREFEERVYVLYQETLIYGAAHPYVGEEAVAVGVCSALEPDDYVVSTHRGHGHCIAKGANVKLMMAELMGKETGYCKGKGGSQHIVDFGIGFIGAQGIVGAGIPIAAGAAIASQLRNLPRVTVSFFGDGASNTGSFHEGINLAACYNLPVVYVLENNLYAVTTPIKKTCKLSNLADRAKAYGISGKVVDGNNIFEVYGATKEVVNQTREGKGPTLIECKTYRWRGHYIGDPGLYRSKEELEAWKEKDPIKFLGKYLVENKFLTPQEDEEIKTEVKRQIDEAVEYAKKSPEPSLDTLTEDVYYSGEK